MTTSTTPPQLSYFERLLQDSDSLEALGHSLAFEQLLVDNMQERRVTLSIGNVVMVHHLLPPDVYEVHGFPLDFYVDNFKAELLEQPAEDKEQPNVWGLYASYDVDGEPYRLAATVDKTTLFRRSESDSELLRYDLAPDMASRFMVALATGILYERGVLGGTESLKIPPLTTAKAMDSMLKSMGNLSGHYESKLTACLSMLGMDRVALVRLIEIEEPTVSEVRVDHNMTWQFTGKAANDLIAYQHESVDTRDGGDLLQFWNRLSARQPSDIEADQADCRLEEGQLGDEARVFYPGVNILEYSRVNMTIMALLAPLMEPYAHLDQLLEDDIPEYEADPANLVRLDAPAQEVVLPPDIHKPLFIHSPKKPKPEQP